ncbi:MAG: ATP-dependent helicase [Candidatus Omnitrophica bacterium]|nr:ATP-dependent helicase [Candidatus Omnitrophota bacterium]
MADFNSLYKELNAEQKQAVDAVDGPVLVLAGPGTGKTQLLSVRAANIIQKKKALPESILILTYTNAAAKTMKERLAKIVGFKGYDVRVCTFHSFANSIILDSEEASNYIRERIQITDIENVKAIEYILDHTEGLTDIRPFRAPYFYVRDIQRKIGELKREGISPEEFLKHVKKVKPDGICVEEKHIPRIKALAVAYEKYEELKEGINKDVFDERGRYDYDDMIMIATDALNKEKLLKAKYQEQFIYIMVDEFQDTNGAQLKFLFSLMEGAHSNLCCVGDDDQSIYRFQGASIANFKELKKKFKALKTISLKNNYRSAKDLIELSQALINELPGSERASEKKLTAMRDLKKRSIECWEFTTDAEETCFLVDRIREFKAQIESSKELKPEERENPYNNIAILLRKRSLIPKVIDALLQAGIPYATDGKEDIRQEARVRQMLDVLEMVSIEPKDFEQRDRTLYKLLIADYFQIPHKDILSFINKVNKKKRKKENAALFPELLKEEDISAPLKHAADTIDKLLKNAPFKPAHAVLIDYIKDAGIYGFILDKYDKEDMVRIRELRGLASFINMVKESDFSNPGIDMKGFIDEIRTRNEHGLPITGELVTMTQNGVRIFTAHGSKGQEYHSVIIPFCLQDVSWPIRPMPDKIPLPPELIKSAEKAETKERIKELRSYDETRLFYVAVSRAKSNVLFTSSPRQDKISSSFIRSLGIEVKTSYSGEEAVIRKSLEKSGLNDPLIGTEEILRDMVSEMTLNPTSLNNYLTCRRKFLYDNVLMLPGPKKEGLMFGNAVHDALEHVYRQFMDTNEFPDFRFFKDKFLDALKFQGLEKRLEQRCKERFDGLKVFFDKAASKPVKPLGLENRMPINIDGIIFTGKYDKLEIEDKKAGALRVIDYKTGPSKKHASGIMQRVSLEDESCDGYLRQLVCYKLLYERDKTREDKNASVSHGVLLFVEPAAEESRKYGIKKGEPTEFRVELNDEMVDEMVGIIKNCWRNIQGLRFEKLPERDSKKCSWCDFNHICWPT